MVVEGGAVVRGLPLCGYLFSLSGQVEIAGRTNGSFNTVQYTLSP